MSYYAEGISENLFLQQRIAYSGTSAQYIGYAEPGVGDSDAGWMIFKLDYTSSLMTHKRFAGGSKAFDKVWSNREGYGYA